MCSNKFVSFQFSSLIKKQKKKQNLSNFIEFILLRILYFLSIWALNWVALTVDLSIFIIVILCSLTFPFVLIEPKNGIIRRSNRLVPPLLNSIPFEFCFAFFYGCCIIHCHVKFFIYFLCILRQIQSAPHIGSDHKKKKQNEWKKKKEKNEMMNTIKTLRSDDASVTYYLCW